jgi:hypothetical protein
VKERIIRSTSALWFRLALAFEGSGRWASRLAIQSRQRAGNIFVGLEKERRYLEHNRILKGRHSDRRCVILGSGPSLADVDLAGLSSFITIALNETFVYLKERNSRADYHILIDQDYFTGAPRMDDLLRDIGEFAAQTDGALILDQAGLSAVADQQLIDSPPIFGLRQVVSLGAYANVGIAPPIELESAVPEFEVVSQAAITVALAMGCPEIYLVGHEFDYFRNVTQPTPHVYGDNPYYDDRRSMLESYGNSHHALMAATLHRLAGFAALNEIAQKRNQRIFNATPDSALHVFPYSALL